MKKTKALRFNALDIFLLLAALFALLIGAWYLYGRREESAPISFRCTMRITSVDRELLDSNGNELIRAGQLVRTGNGRTVLGRVEQVAMRKTLRAASQNDKAPAPAERIAQEIELTVLLQASLQPGKGVRVGDSRISAGTNGSFRFGGFYAAKVEILALEMIEG